MKILAINGSHRGARGYTKICIDRIFGGARAAGAECNAIHLAEMRMNPCSGCQVCHSEKHFLRCIYADKDDLGKVFDQMRAADLLIYATPVYVFGMSGLMKTFLDRINSTGDTTLMTISESGLFFHAIDRALCSKPFVTLVCCDNLEDASSANILHYFKTYARFMDARQVGMIVRRSAGLTGYGRDPDREKMFPALADIHRALEEAGRELALKGRISKRTQKRASAGVLPIPFFARLLIKFKPLRRRILPRVQAESRRLAR